MQVRLSSNALTPVRQSEWLFATYDGIWCQFPQNIHRKYYKNLSLKILTDSYCNIVPIVGSWTGATPTSRMGQNPRNCSLLRRCWLQVRLVVWAEDGDGGTSLSFREYRRKKKEWPELKNILDIDSYKLTYSYFHKIRKIFTKFTNYSCSEAVSLWPPSSFCRGRDEPSSP